METMIDLNDLLKGLVGTTFPEAYEYQYYKCLGDNVILINSTIDDCFMESAILPLMQMDKDPNVKEITILLNSDGGDIYIGFAIIPILESLSTPTTLRIMSRALSMAGLIAMAKGKNLKVVCDKYSVGLIHAGSYYMEGNACSVRDTFQFSQRYEEKIKQYILSHTKITEEMYEKIERQEFWMDADDMLAYGIVDEII